MQEQIESYTGIERILIGFSDLAWGTPLLILLLGGGIFLLAYSRLLEMLNMMMKVKLFFILA